MKNCPTCKKDFPKPQNESKKNWENRHVFCSRVCYVKSMKGKTPISIIEWNKIGIAWNKGKELLHLRGENSASWKGGLGSERHQAMGRNEYKSWRGLVFKKDNFTCQACDQYGGYMHADHIKSWSEYPELRYEVSNGRTLCRACHYFVTFKRKMSIMSKWGLTGASAQEA